MNNNLIIAAAVVLVLLLSVLWWVNSNSTAQPPPTTTPPTTTPPTTTTTPIITIPTTSEPPPVITTPVVSTPVETSPPLPTQSPLTPDRWAAYYNTMDPTKWLVLRKQNGTTQCFADPKDAAKCLSLANKIDADDIANYAMIQDLNKIKNNIPVDLYAVINCTDSMRSDPAHWCNMFG